MISSTLWNRFQWNTALLPASPLLKEPFSVRRARFEEKEKATQVALLSLKMNTEWHSATAIALSCIQEAAKRAFMDEPEPSCFVITHGPRMIGVSILDLQPEASSHLLSGPWVLTEYRNRGLGSALLYASLKELAAHGVTEACGITQRNSTASQFVYSKFGGTMSDSPAPIISSE